MKSCCFTGHRHIQTKKEISVSLENEIKNLINNGITDFYAGGALGWDTICVLKILELRKIYSHIRLIMILPCSPAEQCGKWNETDKAIYYDIINSADNIELISDHYYEGCMKLRNQALIDRSDICLCYFNQNRLKSGTGQTVRMAIKKNIKVINLYKNKGGY